jgi:GT2 family glycosyltransferase
MNSLNGDSTSGHPAPSEIEAADREVAALRAALAQKDAVIVELAGRLAVLEKSAMWRAVQLAARIRDTVPGLRALGETLDVAHRAAHLLLAEGPAYTARRVAVRLMRSAPDPGANGAPERARADGTALDRPSRPPQQDAAKAGSRPAQPAAGIPRVSLVIPVSPDATAGALERTLNSLRGQSYGRWEAWLALHGAPAPGMELAARPNGHGEDRIFVKRRETAECCVGACQLAVRSAAGEFVGFLEPGDELTEDALRVLVDHLDADPERDIAYSDEERVDGAGRYPVLKPDWSPDLLLAYNYLGQLTLVRRHLLADVGECRPELARVHSYDLLLRATERARRIGHARAILCRVPARADGDGAEAARQVVADALTRRGVEGAVTATARGHLSVRYRIRGRPRISIVIITRDKGPILRQCIESIEEKTTYRDYELVVVDHDSRDAGTLAYLRALARRWPVHRWSGRFNFSAISNLGAAQATGEYLLFLNNDTRVIARDWLTAMLEHAQRPEVGAVGAKLLYPDGRIQHAGVMIGLGGPAGHVSRMAPGLAQGRGGTDLVRDYSAVTGACMMVARARFAELEGFDERFRVVFNDIDLCLRLRARGYRVVYTPAALLYHYESVTRGRWDPPDDVRLFRRRWGDLIRAGDPYFSANLAGG